MKVGPLFRTLALIGAASAASVGCAARVQVAAEPPPPPPPVEAEVVVEPEPPAPPPPVQGEVDPPIVYASAPVLVTVEPGIFVVQDSDYPCYYTGGFYWVLRDNVWYRAPSYGNGWVVVQGGAVPGTIVHRDHRAYAHYHGAPGAVTKPAPGEPPRKVMAERHKEWEAHQQSARENPKGGDHDKDMHAKDHDHDKGADKDREMHAHDVGHEHDEHGPAAHADEHGRAEAHGPEGHATPEAHGDMHGDMHGEAKGEAKGEARDTHAAPEARPGAEHAREGARDQADNAHPGPGERHEMAPEHREAAHGMQPATQRPAPHPAPQPKKK